MVKFAKLRRSGSLPVRYLAAIALAAAGPATRLPLRAFHFMPLVPRAPFIVVSALALGLGPGLLTTALCVADVIYDALEQTGSLGAVRPADWERAIVVAFTGVFASLIADRLKKSYAHLKDAHRKNAAVLESISDGFAAVNRQWCFTYVNPAAARIMRMPAQDFLGKNLWELWPYASGSAFGAAYRRAAADKLPVQVEAFYPDPLNAWFEMRCYPSRDGLTLFFTDTTERRRREEQLRFLESAAVQTGDGVLILKVSEEGTPGNEPVFLNSAVERITGFTMQDLKRGEFPTLADLAEVHRESAYLEQLTRRKDGSEFWAEYILTSIEDQNGKHTHWVCTLRDITERKQAEETSQLFTSMAEYSDDAILIDPNRDRKEA